MLLSHLGNLMLPQWSDRSLSTATFLEECRVGCHKGTTRALGNVANEVLRLKRMETHRMFDALWKRQRMTRTHAYRWLAAELHLAEGRAHIAGFEMDQCQKVIELCEKMENKEAA